MLNSRGYHRFQPTRQFSRPRSATSATPLLPPPDPLVFTLGGAGQIAQDHLTTNLVALQLPHEIPVPCRPNRDLLAVPLPFQEVVHGQPLEPGVHAAAGPESVTVLRVGRVSPDPFQAG